MKRRLVRAFAIATSAALIAAGAARAEPMEIVQTLRRGDPGLEELGPPRSLAVSADGAHVYAAASDGALWVFARNASGRLAPIIAYRNGEGGITGIDVPTSVLVSADGANVYAANGDPPAVAAFQRDAETGLLAFLATETDGLACGLPSGPFQTITCPNALTATPDGAKVLLIGPPSFELVRKPTTGALEDGVEIPLTTTGEVVQNADGSRLYGTEGVPIQGGGGDLLWLNTRPPDPSSSWGHASLSGSWASIQLSPNGATLYGVDRSPEALRMCWADVDPVDGSVGPQTCRPEEVVSFGSAMAPDGTIYVKSASGFLRYVPDEPGGALGPPEEVLGIGSAGSVAPSSDSLHVYVTNQDSIRVVPEGDAAAGAVAALLMLARFARHERS